MKPIHTTGRLSTRMGEADVAAVVTRLEPWLPQREDWLHGDIELEVGMGNGLALVERAKAAPARLFVGSEVYLNGVKVCLGALEREMAPATPHSGGFAGQAVPTLTGFPKNVRLTNMDAREVLGVVPAGCLSRVIVPFPDPWPKAKHHKRRIVQPDFLEACAQALKVDGELWVITDWPSYAYHAIATVFPHKSFMLEGCAREAADCKPSARVEEAGLGPEMLARGPDWWVPTKYQEKAATAGRGVWFVRAVRR